MWGESASAIEASRTFIQKKHIDPMKAQGLIKGGSFENALVLDENGHALNLEGLRSQNECACHKILDFLGDWALGGKLFLGKVTGYASGHTLNHLLLQKVLSDKNESYVLEVGASKASPFFQEKSELAFA